METATEVANDPRCEIRGPPRHLPTREPHSETVDGSEPMFLPKRQMADRSAGPLTARGFTAVGHALL